jgi:outer membrane protein OmpA-like peptidoglycan-associated protein
MKRLIIPILLTNLLLADCTPKQEQQAKKLWQESRAMQGEAKFAKLKRAMGICGMDRIDVDAYIYIIDKKLKGSDLSIEMLESLSNKIDEIRSINNNIQTHGETFKHTNSQTIERLSHRLAEIKIKVETNQKRLARLNEFQNPTVEQIKSPKRGESIPILIRFAHNEATVQNSPNINTLAQAINEMLLENPNAKFIITGYASARGDAHYNQMLSERRANSVKRYIEQKYPHAKGHIDPFGKGESDLICNGGFGEDTTGSGEYQCVGGSENESSSRRVEVIKQ